jgi:hypothetical protein
MVKPTDMKPNSTSQIDQSLYIQLKDARIPLKYLLNQLLIITKNLVEIVSTPLLRTAIKKHYQIKGGEAKFTGSKKKLKISLVQQVAHKTRWSVKSIFSGLKRKNSGSKNKKRS